MEEFRKINWRLHDLSLLEPQPDFLSEAVLADSLLYRRLAEPAVFHPTRPKLKGLFAPVPYIPGPGKVHTYGKPSLLDAWTQDKCLQAQQLLKSGKDPISYTKSEQFYVGVYHANVAKIQEEQARFQKYAQAQWARFAEKRAQPQVLVDFGRACWLSRWQRLRRYPRFYRSLTSTQLSFNELDSEVQFQCWTNALDLGALARLSCPLLKSPLFLKPSALPGATAPSPSDQPVSEDSNVPPLLDAHPQVGLVASLATLQCLADSQDPKRRWMVPVEIRARAHKTVAFLDEPFEDYEVSPLDLTGRSYQELLRTHLCRQHGIRFARSEAPDEPGEGRIHHNVCYKVWNVKKTCCQGNLMKSSHKPVELNVLVRGRMDACEVGANGALCPVVLRPRLETELHYGAQLSSQSQLCREWTQLFFTPFSSLCRVRIAPSSGEVIDVERCSIQGVAAESLRVHQHKPQLALGTLQAVFERVAALAPGRYLLQHLPKHHTFVAVLQQADEGGDAFDLHAEMDHTKTNAPHEWTPLDPHFQLPQFRALNRMPCMFTPKPTAPPKQNP
ncbi:uncharacterized protein LOC109540142 [Dendroctonus ponderosae]|uniref:uncharacterized protein LOC109540142 n=1 Tax=Dendroctonus ponderosae TaxID=77166 RepID=UPI0020354102|nr:uncharacterized protein LOC109540142 [Dendroctonus ponderosae]